MIVQLNSFEGPLDLLVFLIKKEKMDIFDINVTKITSQYLESMKSIKTADLEAAGDFILMASYLINLKAKVLLKENTESEEEAEDPRKDLSQRLLTYLKVKKYSIYLYSKDRLYESFYPRPHSHTIKASLTDELLVEENGAFLLAMSYGKIIKKVKKLVHKVEKGLKEVSLQIDELRKVLKKGEKFRFSELLKKKKDKDEILLNFLSLLTLSQTGYIQLLQVKNFDEIYIQTLKEINKEKWDNFSY